MKNRRNLLYVILILTVLLCVPCLQKAQAGAAAVETKLDYAEGVLQVKVDASVGKKYLYAVWVKAKDETTAKARIDKMKEAAWDRYAYVVSGTMKEAEVELGSLSLSKDYYLAYKTSIDDTEYRLVFIPKQITKFKVEYNASVIYDGMNGTPTEDTAASAGAFTFTVNKSRGSSGEVVTADAIQMRNRTSGKWVSYGAISVKKIANYHVKGTTLYFRVAADQKINASSQTYNYWPGKMVKVKLSPIAKAPSVKVNGATLTAALKKGQEYSFDEDNWVDVTTAHGSTGSNGKVVVNAVSLFQLYQSYDKETKTGVSYPIDTKLQESSPVAIYVRKAALGKKPVSRAVECELTHSVNMTKDILPQIAYQLNYSSTGGIKITNATTSAIQIAVVDYSKVFVTSAALSSGTAVSFEAINYTNDVITMPVKTEDASVVLTGEAIKGECFNLTATKGDTYIPWVDVAKGKTDKAVVTKVANKKYASIPADKRIILVRFKSVAKTKTEAMKIASDIVIFGMPETVKQTIATNIPSTSATDLATATTAAVTVGSGTSATKQFTVDLTATNMNAEYVSPAISWVTADGNPVSRPKGVSTVCGGTNRIYNGTGHVLFKVTKQTPTGVYYAKIKAESAEALIKLSVTNGNPTVVIEDSSLTVAQEAAATTTVTVTGVSSYSADKVNFALYQGDTVSGSAITGFNDCIILHNWSTSEINGISGYKGTLQIEPTHGSTTMPVGTYCLEISANNDIGTTKEKIIVRVTASE